MHDRVRRPRLRGASTGRLPRPRRVAGRSVEMDPYSVNAGGPMKTIGELQIKIFADGADRAGMLDMYAKPYIKGFTTNPTLMRKAGISDYRAFAKEVLQAIP